MSTETEFEQDVTRIVRKVVAKDYNSAMAGLEERLVEKLQDILKRKETETISKNSRGPIETAPMVVIPEGFDPELLDVWAYTAAAQEGKWVALVYNMMAEIPRISDSLANGKDVRTVSRAHGQQSMTFKSGGRILWLAKDLKGGRGVSVNLVLRVQKRGLCIANEEALWARPTEPVHERPPLSPYGNTSDQVWYNIHRVMPVGAANAITSNHIFDKVKALGGAIFPDSVYVEVLRRMVAETVGVNRRFSGQWLYYRDA